MHDGIRLDKILPKQWVILGQELDEIENSGTTPRRGLVLPVPN
jgi:hypothetical protein